MTRRRFFWVLLVLVSLVSLFGLASRDDGSGRSRQSKDWELCTDQSLVNIERRIEACTAIIETKGETARRLARAYCSRASAYQYNGHPDQAIADYDDAVKLEPDDADQYLCRGNGYSARDDYDRAISDYSRAIGLEPNYGNPYNNRGLAYYAKRDFDRAIADFDVAIRIEAEPDRYDNRGEAYRAKGDLDRAIADYDRAIELNPRYVRARYGRASAYSLKGDHDHEMADLDEAMRLDPTGGYPFANRGRARFYAAIFDAAVSDLARAVAAQPHYAPNVIWLYLARARLGDQAAAAELEANATELQQTDWQHSIVELFLDRRTPDAALAAASGPDQQCETQFYVGEWHLLHQDQGAALQDFEAALDSCAKTYFAYQGARAELSRLRP